MNAANHHERQRQGVRDGERRERHHELAHGARREEQPGEKHQMVVARQNVTDAESQETPDALPAVDGDAARSTATESDLRVQQLLGRRRIIHGDGHQLTMAARTPLRHIGGDGSGSGPERAAATAKRQAHARAAVIERECRRVIGRKRLAIHGEPNRRRAQLAQFERPSVPPPGASSATSAADIERMAETTSALTLTSSELRPGSCARRTPP